LEEFLLFCICVAGKNAKTTARLLDGLLRLENKGTPFQKIRRMIRDNDLLECLRMIGIGQYNRISKAFAACLQLDLRTVTIQDLEAVHGIGPKTARFFIVHSRRNQKHAVIDTHMTKYVKQQGRWNITKGKGTEYEQVEKVVLEMAKEKKMSPAKFDLWVWRKMSGNLPVKK